MQKIKIHRPVWLGALHLLEDVMGKNLALDQSIQKHFKSNPKWGSRDRKVIGKISFDVVRWWRKFLTQAGHTWSDNMEVNSSLIESAMQAWAFDHDFAVPDEDSAFVPKEVTEAESESYPDWMQKNASKEMLKALNSEASIYIRPNLIKTTSEKLQTKFADLEVKSEKIEGSIKIISKDQFRKVARAKDFPPGDYEVQDLGSQKVVQLIDAKKGEKILDACAGNGGKTLHLGQSMQNQGEIIALDISPLKISNLKKRCEVAGLTNVKATVIPEASEIRNWKCRFDKVLLDVPCSGLGVIRRHPERKWQLTQNKLAEFVAIQKQILEDYKHTVKIGGSMVYVTCTFNKDENEMQIGQFLNRNKNFTKIDERFILSHEGDWDTFYFCKLSRNS